MQQQRVQSGTPRSHTFGFRLLVPSSFGRSFTIAGWLASLSEALPPTMHATTPPLRNSFDGSMRPPCDENSTASWAACTLWTWHCETPLSWGSKQQALRVTQLL